MFRPFQVEGILLTLLCFTPTVAYDVVFSTMSTLATTQTASYDCRVSSLWTSGRHPEDYPSNATFEVPIIVSHGTAYELFNLNELASSSLQVYAEVRRRSRFQDDCVFIISAMYSHDISVIDWNNQRLRVGYYNCLRQN